MNNEIKIFLKSSYMVLDKLNKLSTLSNPTPFQLKQSVDISRKIGDNITTILKSMSKRLLNNQEFIKELKEWERLSAIEPEYQIQMIKIYNEIFKIIERYAIDDDLEGIER